MRCCSRAANVIVIACKRIPRKNRTGKNFKKSSKWSRPMKCSQDLYVWKVLDWIRLLSFLLAYMEILYVISSAPMHRRKVKQFLSSDPQNWLQSCFRSYSFAVPSHRFPCFALKENNNKVLPAWIIGELQWLFVNCHYVERQVYCTNIIEAVVATKASSSLKKKVLPLLQCAQLLQSACV